MGADFPRITPHDLRHIAASLVVSGGGNVLALARMLGHQSPKETLETYADLFDTDLDALADVLDQARAVALNSPPAVVASCAVIVDDRGSAGETYRVRSIRSLSPVKIALNRLFAVGVAGFEPTTSSSRTLIRCIRTGQRVPLSCIDVIVNRVECPVVLICRLPPCCQSTF